MVREARFLWSDPFENPQRFAETEPEDLDEDELAPLKKRRRSRRRKSSDPESPEEVGTPPDWPTAESAPS